MKKKITNIRRELLSQFIELEFQTKQQEKKHQISRHIAIKEKKNGMIIITINKNNHVTISYKNRWNTQTKKLSSHGTTLKKKKRLCD